MYSILFRLFLVASESLNFSLFYLFAVSGFEAAGFVDPWSFLTVGASVAAVNLAMGRGNFRYLTIALANVAIFWISLRMGRNTLSIYTVSGSPPAMAGFLATWVLLLFVAGRAAFLSWTKDPPRYGLFDINIAALFLMLLLASSFGVALPGVHVLLFLAILSNLLMLFFGSRRGGPGQGSRRSLLALAALLVPVWLIGNSDILSVLEQPAESVIEFSKPFFELLLQGLMTVLLVIFRIMKLVPRKEEQTFSGGGPAVAEEGLVLPGETGPLMQILLWGMTLAVLVLAVLSLLYMLWLLFHFLLHKRAGPASGEAWSRPSFRSFLVTLFRAMKRLALIAGIFLPLPITAERAYGFLLFWGKHRGSPRKADETAYEYLERLLEKFPNRERELSRITGSFVRHRYSREGKVFERGLKWYVLKLYVRVPFVKGT